MSLAIDTFTANIEAAGIELHDIIEYSRFSPSLVKKFFEENKDLIERKSRGENKTSHTISKLDSLEKFTHDNCSLIHEINFKKNTDDDALEKLRTLNDELPNAIERLAISTSIQFDACWNKKNNHLKKSTEKITRRFRFYLNKLIAFLVVPACSLKKRKIEIIKDDFYKNWDTNPTLKENYMVIPIEVTTPDKVTIRGTYFKNVNDSDDDPNPIVICMQPNATISKNGFYNWLLELAVTEGVKFNFVYFDYRGCGESDGTLRSVEDLYLDGESIYQFVNQEINVNEVNIHFFCYSLGGNIGPNVKKMHPECTGRLVIDRSGTSLKSIVGNICSVAENKAESVLSSMNWNMQSVDAINESQGETLIIHHPKDEVVSKKASLCLSPLKKVEKLDLSQSPNVPKSNFFAPIHSAKLSSFVSGKFNPIMTVSAFLFLSDEDRTTLKDFESESPEFRDRVFKKVEDLLKELGTDEEALLTGEEAFNKITLQCCLQLIEKARSEEAQEAESELMPML